MQAGLFFVLLPTSNRCADSCVSWDLCVIVGLEFCRNENNAAFPTSSANGAISFEEEGKVRQLSAQPTTSHTSSCFLVPRRRKRYASEGQYKTNALSPEIPRVCEPHFAFEHLRLRFEYEFDVLSAYPPPSESGSGLAYVKPFSLTQCQQCKGRMMSDLVPVRLGRKIPPLQHRLKLVLSNLTVSRPITVNGEVLVGLTHSEI